MGKPALPFDSAQEPGGELKKKPKLVGFGLFYGWFTDTVLKRKGIVAHLPFPNLSQPKDEFYFYFQKPNQRLGGDSIYSIYLLIIELIVMPSPYQGYHNRMVVQDCYTYQLIV